jgi:D-alanine-D-alanine ligase-like ATP-grasp enzyme
VTLITNKVTAAFGRAFGLGLKAWLKLSGRSNQIEFEARVDTYRDTWRRTAEELGAEFSELDHGIWQITHRGRCTRFSNYRVEFDNPVILNLAGRKDLVYRMLASHGIAIPEHQVFKLDDLGVAFQFFDRIGTACVVKPADGFGGKGVTTHISRRWRVRLAAVTASLYSQTLLIETHVFGESCRILVINGKCAHAVRRRGIWITGNGRDSIRKLIVDQIGQAQDANDFALDKCLDIALCLQHQGLELNDVLPTGKISLVRSSSVLSMTNVENRTTYTEDITLIIDQTLKETAEKCAQIVGSNYLGVDIITPDISLSLAESGGVINEVNTTPALHHHLGFDTPESRGIAQKVVLSLLECEDKPNTTSPPVQTCNTKTA